MSSKFEEQIIVAPRSAIFENESLTFQGVFTDEELTKKIAHNFANTYSVMRRGGTTDATPKENNAEINEEFKQAIPYVVIRRDNEVFTYKRLSGGGEKRLVNQVSIGIGGHSNPTDDEDFFSTLLTNMQREIYEELYLDTDKIVLNSVGLINDDTNSVGKVHLGFLVVADLKSNAKVSVRETDQLEGEWISIDELKKPEVYETLETWSQFVVDTL